MLALLPPYLLRPRRFRTEASRNRYQSRVDFRHLLRFQQHCHHWLGIIGGSIDYSGDGEPAAQALALASTETTRVASVRRSTQTWALYRVDFALRGTPTTARASQACARPVLSVRPSVLITIPGGTTRTNMNWADYGFDFTALGSSTTHELLGETPSTPFYGPALDNFVCRLCRSNNAFAVWARLAGAAIRRRFRARPGRAHTPLQAWYSQAWVFCSPGPAPVYFPSL